MSQKIGVFGGTFDPPHIGHLVAALNAQHVLGLDLVLFVVANVPWQKVGSRQIAPVEVRVAMVEAAVADLPGCEASLLEIERGGDSYTVDTLAELHDTNPGAELFLIVGTDVADSLDTWHRPDEVARLSTLAVLERPGSEGAAPPDAFRAVRVEAPLVDLSSTELRARMSNDRPVRFLVPDAVLDVWIGAARSGSDMSELETTDG